ncbi:S8 family serine peptidase [Clostridium omnivorum]|uniref:NlpC/P60 domain-containing protein n=1 Tax=Clostridium omnivorum TaxID=1604902 RepID=A0ABQ5N3B0_9CLOT|nr:S8 family serine peptidase [Clostridium sp. E14]GLC29700.1 hypothetical protein bsdE14_11100 [Clostridium sp. E14]
MKKKVIKSISIMLTIILSMGIQSKTFAINNRLVNKEEVKIQNSNRHKYVQGEVIIKYKDTVNTLDKKNQVKAQYSLKHKSNLSKINAEVVSISSGSTVDETVSKLKANKDIELVQPNFIYNESDLTSDTRSNELWGLENDGQIIGGKAGQAGVDIDIKDAWKVTQGTDSVVVGVIDSGIDINHPDLKDKIWTNTKEIPGNGIDDDGNGYVDDVNGWDFYNNDNTVYDEKQGDKHGTHVAGTIAAALNQLGVVGVAPKVKIMPLKFIGPFGGTTEGAIKAIEYAKSMGVKILNNSWGGGGYDSLLKSTIENSGTIFIVAAGNEQQNNDANPSYPAAFDSSNILSVAAVDNLGNMPSFSNYGLTSVDVGAPGVNILSTIPRPIEIGAAVRSENAKYKTFVQGVEIGNFYDYLSAETYLKNVMNYFNIQATDSVLIVEDDESSESDTNSYAYVYKDMMSDLGYTNITYKNVALNNSGPDLATLSSYKYVFWITGSAYASTITQTDQQNLETYLNNGGNLYLSGNNLSNELFETDFAKYYLHVNYLYNENNRTTLTGVQGEFMQGQNFSIYSSHSDMIEACDSYGKVVVDYLGEDNYDNSYQYLNGTSMATPHVSGIAALLLSKGVDDPLNIKQKIMSGAKALNSLNSKVVTGGMVNAANSINLLKDVNNDNKIDIMDLAAVAQNYNMKSGNKDWKQIYDLNGDNVIDIFDLVNISKSIASQQVITGDKVVAYASNYLGTPYLWGGTTPSGFDDSGFVQYVYANFNINLPRTVYDQVNYGTEVLKTDLQPGDLVFFGTSGNPVHVGIYTGNNSFIHSPQTGDVIKISSIDTRTDFLCGRRLF